MAGTCTRRRNFFFIRAAARVSSGVREKINEARVGFRRDPREPAADFS